MKRGIVLMLGMLLATLLPAGAAGNYFLSPTTADSQQEQVCHALTGAWEIVIPELTLTDTGKTGSAARLQLKTALLSFRFRPDGTFTRVLTTRNGSLRFEEEGRWEVSKDESTLLLYWPDPDGGQYTQYVRIKMLEMDEMVLEQPLSVVGQEFVALDKNDYYFNKQ